VASKAGVRSGLRAAVKDHLRLEIGGLEHEVLCVSFLDAQHRIIELKQVFRGTVTQTLV
jgi:DNA repair protein RadC